MKDPLTLTALDLFEARGYDHVTVTDIAEAAGVTARTFYRRYPDKRDVLFPETDRLRDRLLDALRATSPDVSPFEAVSRAAGQLGEVLTEEDRPWQRRRHDVVSRTPALQERVAAKQARTSSSVAALLRERGVDAGLASVVADLGIAVVKRAVLLWILAAPGSFAELSARATREVVEHTHDVSL